MKATKRLKVLDFDNWFDYLPGAYLGRLVAKTPPSEEGYDGDDDMVTRLLAWVSRKSDESKEFRFQISRDAAAYVLNMEAGWDPALLKG
jgi:hypothetical protein